MAETGRGASYTPRDPRQPLPGEWTPAQQRRFTHVGLAIVLVGVGAMLGYAVTPESPAEAQARIAALTSELAITRARVAELERTMRYKAAGESKLVGKLKPADRERHEREAKKYAKVLRQVKAQSAADLMQWFVARWNGLLDQPESNDRTTRRAELLSQLVGGMAANVDPNDYVPWQAEFLNGGWLGELHFDLDGDGFPGKLVMANPHDGFVDKSVCHIAMALNATVRDARLLVMPDMRCDRPEAKMSVFLQGRTMDEALAAFVAALKSEGFAVVERADKAAHLVLIGQGTRGQKRDD